ncbi:MAG: NAD(P)-dependent oxidoreductase [Rhizorhabdus sp.]|nr:NAD(P)-dependent oxidoreductase [Rhizorhabdus sp.]
MKEIVPPTLVPDWLNYAASSQRRILNMQSVASPPIARDTAHIGYIGLGDMGGSIAGHLIEEGWKLYLYARQESALAPFRGGSATILNEARDVAAAADILCICVSDDAQVENVLFGNHGIATALREGAVVIIQSTIAPESCRRFAGHLAPRGIATVDAPVSGGAERARRGALTIACGGDPDIIARCMPLLEAQATLVLRVGDIGSGQLLKLINNSVYAANLAVALEATRTGQAMGLNIDEMWDVLRAGSAGSMALDTHAHNIRKYGRMFPGPSSYANGTAGILAKDIGLFRSELDKAGLGRTAIDHIARDSIETILSFAPE